MRNDLIVLTFKVLEEQGNHTKELNIDDKLVLDYFQNKYILTNQDHSVIYGEQIYTREERLESMLNYVGHRYGETILIWDNERNNFIVGTEVTICAIDNNYIVIKLSESDRNLLNYEQHKNNNEISLESMIRDLCFSVEEGQEDKETVREAKEEKEETRMFSDLGSSFGKINSEQFRLSINGLAVRGREEKYLTFNPETRELIEVTTGFFDDMKDLLFLMPTTELEVGDIILHQNKPYYITVSKDNVIKGIDFEDAIESVLVPKTNVFGIKYYTKVFNCLGTNNILGSDMTSNPMMIYALMGGKDFDLSKIMLFQAMSGQGKGIADFSENPMMLMALMSNENGGGDLGNFAKMQILTQLAGKKKEAKKVSKEN